MITNFATTQVKRLETLSTDTVNLLQNCRSSVDAAVSKNVSTIETMSKLLDDLKANTETMKTIAPSISESIDTMTSLQNEVRETEKLKEEHEKRSDEQTKKLASIGDAIKSDSDENKSEIMKIVTSVNNHTKLFAATMKSSKVKILEQIHKQKTFATEAFNSIETKISDGNKDMEAISSDIASVINDAGKNLTEDSESNLNFKRNVTACVQTFGTSSTEKLDALRNVVVDFHNKDLKVYSSSGK